VAEERRAGSRADSGPDRLDDLLRTRNGKSNRRPHVSRAEVSADVLPRKVECVVFEVGREDLVTRAAVPAARRRRSQPPLRSGRTPDRPDPAPT
jgi:hypothetical protein